MRGDVGSIRSGCKRAEPSKATLMLCDGAWIRGSFGRTTCFISPRFLLCLPMALELYITEDAALGATCIWILYTSKIRRLSLIQLHNSCIRPAVDSKSKVPTVMMLLWGGGELTGAAAGLITGEPQCGAAFHAFRELSRSGILSRGPASHCKLPAISIFPTTSFALYCSCICRAPRLFS